MFPDLLLCSSTWKIETISNDNIDYILYFAYVIYIQQKRQNQEQKNSIITLS